MVIRHNCGFCVAHTLHDVYSFIKSLQHRGREATGIAFIGEEGIDVIKWVGSVERFGIADLYKLFPSEKYHTYMAHVRYATRGRKDKILRDAHPVVVGGSIEDKGNHVIVSGCDAVMVHNGQVSEEDFSSKDKEGLKGDVDTEMLLKKYVHFGEEQMLTNIPGSYSLAVASKNKRGVRVIRDRHGMKPAVLGWKDGKYLAASEDIAFKKNGGLFIDDVRPGNVYVLYPEGNYERKSIIQKKWKKCFFEYNYISNAESILDGVSVRHLREVLGAQLAKEFGNIKADFVTFLPRCPEAAARRFAEETKLDFLDVFYKTRNERSFLGSNEDERKSSISTNLYLLSKIKGIDAKEFLRNKTLILIDDSTIRGNNSRRAVELLTAYGVKKVYLINYTPKIGIVGDDGVKRGCLYGVDMPPQDNFVVRNRSDEQINEKIGAEVLFLSIKGMLEGFEKLGIKKEELCYFCIGGKKPF